MRDLEPALSPKGDDAFFILMKAREFDAKVKVTDPDPASDAIDDRSVDVLGSRDDDAVDEELAGAIAGLDEDQRLDLIALAWIGRDFTFEDWAQARTDGRRGDPTRAAVYRGGLPGLSDDLEAALTQPRLSLEDYLDSHLARPVAPQMQPVI